eukprot:COSAG01_NODE_297_length_19258_cov_8.905110_19_plen_89_part_00
MKIYAEWLTYMVSGSCSYLSISKPNIIILYFSISKLGLLMLSLGLCYGVYRSDYARICHPKGNADGTHGQDVEAIIGGSLTRKEHLDV